MLDLHPISALLTLYSTALKHMNQRKRLHRFYHVPVLPTEHQYVEVCGHCHWLAYNFV